MDKLLVIATKFLWTISRKEMIGINKMAEFRLRHFTCIILPNFFARAVLVDNGYEKAVTEFVAVGMLGVFEYREYFFGCNPDALIVYYRTRILQCNLCHPAYL